jgi:hypothetical protein
MSSSDFNKLLAEKHDGDSWVVEALQITELYYEYIKLHLPDERIEGEQTNKLADGVQLGAIYIVKYDDVDDDDDGYWFVVGYTEEWGLELLYGETIEGRITREGLSVWKGLIRNSLSFRKRYSPNRNNTITDYDILVRILKFFIGSAHRDNAEIFIAYSPHPYSLYPSNSRTLNFSKRGFMQ